jgi:hypothetical protein
MIAYHFPPCGGAGVQRTLKFVKYLREFNWEPVVITIKEKGYPNYPYDYSLLEEIPGGIQILRVHSFVPFFFYKVFSKLHLSWIFKFLFIPELEVTWVMPAFLTALKVVKNKKISLIYTTSSPYSTHFIGYLLKRITNCPWVIDFRDPWTQNALYNPPSILHRKIDEFLESSIIRYADKVIANTEGNRKKIIEKFCISTSEKVVTIPNGFDNSDFTNTNGHNFKKFTIVYNGNFYGEYSLDFENKILNNNVLSHSPVFFLQALKELFEEEPKLRKDIQTIFVGKFRKGNELFVDKLGINENVKIADYISHKKSIQYLISADVLLLVLFNGKGGETWVPAKLYEYINSNKPILALVPDGDTSRIIQATKTGVIIPPQDIKRIKEEIRNMYYKFKSKKLKINPDWKIINQYERKKLTAKLAQLFDEVFS